MNRFCAIILLGITLLTGEAFGAQVSFGIRIGPPPAARVVRVLPARPGPNYVWVNPYWYPVGQHWKWHKGYWTQAPYSGARWLQPRYEGGQYFAGYWAGDRGRIEHDHHWDRDKYRDYREHERHYDHDH